MKSIRNISRRRMLAMLAFSPIGAVVARAAESNRINPSTFVLVHGAWHGGWCWRKITPLLRAAEHQVFTPTLTGLGEHSHLLTPEVDLDTHIKDIALVLEYEDLQDVVLVGHSYGGMVIAGVLEAAGARVAHLVYLDAFLPEDGKAVQDYAPLPPTRNDGWRIPLPGTIREMGVTKESDITWVEPRLGDHPYKTFTQPVRIPTERYTALPKTFIQASDAPWFVEAAERAKRQGFRYYEMLSAGHDVMITQPDELSKILLELV